MSDNWIARFLRTRGLFPMRKNGDALAIDLPK